MEQWRAVPEYEGLYAVSDLGRVKSLSRPTPCIRGTRIIRERVLKFQLAARVGYPCVVLYRKGKPSTHSIHSLVMRAFGGERPAGMEVCHWNGDPLDNRLSNLRYDTRAANRQDGRRLGEIPRGSSRAQSKLTEASVVALRAAVATGERRAVVAQRYGISPMTVGKIVRRETWAHI